MGFLQFLLSQVLVTSRIQPLFPVHPTPTHPGLGAEGNLGLGQEECSQEPRDRGRWGLELLPKETYLLQSQQLPSCLETERTPVSAQHWTSPGSLLLSQ